MAALALVVITALGPADWQPRTALGREADHFLGYFAITLLFCLAWPRPVVIAAALVVFAGLLEWLQSFTPDRTPNIFAELYGAGGVLVAALLAELVIRVRRRRSAKTQGGGAQRRSSAWLELAKRNQLYCSRTAVCG